LFSPKHPDQLCSPLRLLLSKYHGAYQWLGHAVNHSPPSSAKVKNYWSYTPSPLCMPSWCGQGKIFLFLNLKAYARTVPQIRPYQLPSTTFRIHYAAFILTTDAVYSAILAALLNNHT